MALPKLVDRILPPLKAMDANVAMGPLTGSLADQGRAVLAAITDARFTPDQAATLPQALGSLGRTVETSELEERICRLEERNCKGT